NADGTGNSSTSKLSIQAGAVVVSANTLASGITLRSFDVDIDTSANPAAIGARRTLGSTASTFVSSGLSFPVSLAYDASGNLFIANASDNTVSEVAAGSSTATTFLSGLDQPRGLAFDASGNLFIANFGNFTVSKVAAGA